VVGVSGASGSVGWLAGQAGACPRAGRRSREAPDEHARRWLYRLRIRCERARGRRRAGGSAHSARTPDRRANPGAPNATGLLKPVLTAPNLTTPITEPPPSRLREGRCRRGSRRRRCESTAHAQRPRSAPAPSRRQTRPPRWRRPQARRSRDHDGRGLDHRAGKTRRALREPEERTHSVVPVEDHPLTSPS
jgi:hypothetical protein